MFTNNQIDNIKLALKYCGNVHGCEHCPYNKITPCQDKLNLDSLALIHDYESTIAELESQIDKQYEQAEADIRANMADGGTSCHWCIDGNRKEGAKQLVTLLKKDIAAFVTNVEDVHQVVDNCFKQLFGE